MNDGIGLHHLEKIEHGTPISNVDIMVGVAGELFIQARTIPKRVTLRPEKDRALVVVETMDAEALVMEKSADLRADQSCGTGDKKLHAPASMNIRPRAVKAEKLTIAPPVCSRQMIKICVSSKRREAEHAEKSAEFFVGGDGGIFNLKPLKFPLRSLRLGVSAFRFCQTPPRDYTISQTNSKKSRKSQGCRRFLGGMAGMTPRFDSAPLMTPDLTNEPDQTRFEVMKILNVQEAKTHLSRLMEDAAAGEEILLAKHGKPMVRLSAYRPKSEPRKLGGYEKQIRVAEDFDEEDPRILALFNAS